MNLVNFLNPVTIISCLFLCTLLSTDVSEARSAGHHRSNRYQRGDFEGIEEERYVRDPEKTNNIPEEQVQQQGRVFSYIGDFYDKIKSGAGAVKDALIGGSVTMKDQLVDAVKTITTPIKDAAKTAADKLPSLKAAARVILSPLIKSVNILWQGLFDTGVDWALDRYIVGVWTKEAGRRKRGGTAEDYNAFNDDEQQAEHTFSPPL